MTYKKGIPRILIVDDNTAIHTDYIKILKAGDENDLASTEAALFGDQVCSTKPVYQIDSAYNGQQALEMVQAAIDANQPFSLVFMDILMPPGWDGIETISHIWKVDPALQVAICSAHSDYSWDSIAQKLGYSDNYMILKKPFEPIEIEQIALSMTMKWSLRKQTESQIHNLEDLVREKTRVIQHQVDNLELLVAEKTKEIKKSEERYSLAAESANDGLWDWDVATGQVFYSARFKHILRLKESDQLQTIEDWCSFVHADDQIILQQMLKDHLEGRSERVELECRMITKLNEPIWVYIRGLAAYEANKAPLRIVGFMTDISERKMHDQALYDAAFHDELTGLANRALFMNRLEQVIARERRLGEQHAALMFLDLDRFKSINDTLGHQIGDEVLRIVAMVLKNHTRPTDTVSRIGGDEFTVLFDPVESLAEAEGIADRILKQLNRAYDINEREVYIGSSIGLTLIDDANVDPHIFLRNADLAMYQAKTSGKSMIEIFDQQKHRMLLDHMEIENDLRNAVKNDELLVYYQPIIDLKTGHVSSFESLMRWRHPLKGFVSPGRFIPLAEEIGLIGHVGVFALDTVCKQLRLWHAEREDCPRITVNVSVRQLIEPQIFESMLKILTEMQELARFISIEVTESVIMKDPKLIIDCLHQLQKLGMKIYIDDFGTGYSSLSYLASFPLDFIKIDQSFVASMLTDAKSERLVATIIKLAADMGLKTVAEGVETEEQMFKLIDLNCDYGQGHYFAKAMNAQVAREIVYNNTRFSLNPSVVKKSA